MGLRRCISRVEVSEQAGQIARLVEHGARGDLELRPHLVSDDVGEGGLAQTRGAVQQHVVERFAAQFGRLHEYPQVGHYLVLPVEIIERERT